MWGVGGRQVCFLLVAFVSDDTIVATKSRLTHSA